MKFAPSEIRYALAQNMASAGIAFAHRAHLYEAMMRLGFTARELKEHGAQALCRAVEMKLAMKGMGWMK